MEILFFLTAGLAAGVLGILDIVSGSEEPYEALRTKEVLFLYMLNALLAALIAYALHSGGQIQLDFLTWIAVVLGYPILVHTKIFTIRGKTPDQDLSIGVELFYQQVSKILVPGIERSIEERGMSLLHKFRAMPLDKIVIRAEDFIALRNLPDRERNRLEKWLKNIKEDSAQNPDNEDKNKRAIFLSAHDRLPEFMELEKLPPHNTSWDVPDKVLDSVYAF
ncbi:MAG: hypothetical protein ACUVV0_04300 [Anaerolineae bacterium]